MKLQLTAAATLAAMLSVTAYAAIDEAMMAEFESDCNRYAQEDGVAPEELDDYLSQCVQDLVISQSTNESDFAESQNESSEGENSE
jgi:hypothetical protein